MNEPSASTWLAIDGAGCVVVVRVDAAEALNVMVAPFAAMISQTAERRPDVVVSRVGEKYHTSDDAGRAFIGSLSDLAWAVRYCVTRRLMRARPDLLWLHASGVERDGVAVLFAGPSAAGKSTLTDALVRDGWRLLADDLIPFDPRSGRVQPLPIMPAVRVAVREHLSLAGVRALPKIERPISKDRVAGSAVRPSLVVFPVFDRAGFEWNSLGPAAAAVELLRHCLNLRERGDDGVRALARVCAACTAARVRYHEPNDVVRLIAPHLETVRA